MTKHFVVHLADKQRHLMTEQLIRDHVHYLTELSRSGALIFCGPCADGTALMILRCADVDEANRLLEGDPFSQVNYYRSRRIVEILAANEQNQFHLPMVLDNLAKR
jgi:uncharacterized protein YciI